MKTLPYLFRISLACLLLSCSSGDDGATSVEGKAKNPAMGPVEIPPVSDEGPGFLTVFADADEVMGNAPHTVKLDVDVVDGTGTPPYSYKWDFGDATEFSEERSPTHVYEIPGSFRASVIVRDARGQIDQDYVDITVNEDFEYEIDPEQLREVLPLEDVAEKVKEQMENAARAGTEAGAQAESPQP